MVRKTLCEPEQSLRFRRIMDEGTQIVVNLTKGRLGTDVSAVLGGLILSMITNAGLSRDSLAPHQRRPFIVYVDEFASFTTETIAGMLSELRKYAVWLVLAAQFLSAIKPAIQDAVLGNAGTLIVFRLGAQDAPLTACQLRQIDPENLINLPNYRMYLRLMVDGVASKVFSGQSIRRSVNFLMPFTCRRHW